MIVPSTNTVVEAEYNLMRPEKVSFHAGRIYIEQPVLDSNEAWDAFHSTIRTEIVGAVKRVVTTRPQHLIMGMSSETFWDGEAGNAEFESWMEEVSRLSVTTGASACRQALTELGAKKIAIITPYQPRVDREVAHYFTDVGFDVRYVAGMQCPTATAIALVREDQVRSFLLAANSKEVDAIVQVGTNLSAVGVAAELEKELQKPVLAINAATVWCALRKNGISDQMDGFGRILSQF